jgi:hypothetical protein
MEVTRLHASRHFITGCGRASGGSMLTRSFVADCSGQGRHGECGMKWGLWKRHT